MQEKSGCQPGASRCSPVRIPSADSVVLRIIEVPVIFCLETGFRSEEGLSEGS